MRSALTIAAKELVQRTRDRSAIIIAFAVPFALTAILSLTLSEVDEEGEFSATFGVVDLDGGELPTAFAGLLGELDFVEVRNVPTVARADALADDGDLDGAFVFPEGFSERALAGEGGELLVIRNPEASVEGLIARSLAESFTSDVNAVNVAVATALAADAAHAGVAEVVELARQTPPAAAIEQDTAENRLFTSTTFYAAGMAVFFIFFTVEFGVRSLLEERQGGTLARLLVAPMLPAWIIAGKALAAFVVGIVSMAALILGSTLLLGADWGDPLGVGLLAVAGVLAAMGLTAIVATLAKTPVQASNYASVAAVSLGLLGGTFFPISQGPDLLVNLSLIAPQAWLMRGFQDLASGGGIADIVPSLAAVLAFAVVLGAAAGVRAWRLVPR